MIQHATLTNDNEDSGSMIEIESNLGTMVINDDESEDTMQSKKYFVKSLFYIVVILIRF